MHKKLGPLETWQWAAIAAALIVVYYLYEHEKNAASSSTSTTGTSTDNSGAIDPTTGIPYADEGGSGSGLSGSGGGVGDTTGTTDSGSTLSGELGDLGAIEQLMSGLGLGTGGSTTNTTVTGGLSKAQTATLNADLKNLNKTLKKLTPPRRKVTKPANHKNPGHRVTTHPHGKKSASSSAPHNARQHVIVAAPAHQRAATPKPYAIKPPATKKKKARR